MLLAGGVVVAVSAGVTVNTPAPSYTAAVRLVGTTIGVGASYDAFGLSIPVFFYGSVIPEGDSYHTVPYPAQISVSIPIISDLPGLSDLPYWTQSLKRSEAIGAGYLLKDIAAVAAGEKVRIIGVSQGTQVAEIARNEMSKIPDYVANAQNYEFLLLGDPYQPNGGILARLSAWRDLPVLGDIFPLGRPGPSDSPFKTTFYQNQYDGVADFPAYFNVLSIANAIAGMAFGHAFPGYVMEYPDAPNAVTTQVGNTTYVTLPQYLPLLAPLRIPASLIGAERFVDAIDPVLRVLVEMGYDRTADPSRVKEFSWTMPEEKVTEALDALPGAFEQSLAILGGEKYVPTLPQPVVSDAEPDTPLPEHPADPVGTSPAEQRLRKAMDDIAAALSNATRPLAKVFQSFGGRTPTAEVTDTTDKPTAPVHRLNRSARMQLDQPRSAPAQRLKMVRDAHKSGEKPARATKRAAKQATKQAAKQAAKTGHDQRHDPPKRKSKRAS
ncbi:PE-PPE domain-containing protein [Mycolicibacterium boenickei]|uniref:PE-PPE domain-containing protein n=1 Tax=Mycolicibacterium boenickei TaxID=146017 RepID=A0AAX2ZUE2_9MYCO|nr:PE-PPE domain-containing protein [Mycolicibacterium boenickei]PEG61036.1 PE-PPE domain-containing protein [Mycolicibacterium boenickei]UNB98883.1 PE-PPE domain-containing protein [Mycolicibacterium boenickei]BBX88455.1 PE/PPE family protein [Mycolicibacterium boenickei]